MYGDRPWHRPGARIAYKTDAKRSSLDFFLNTQTLSPYPLTRISPFCCLCPISVSIWNYFMQLCRGRHQKLRPAMHLIYEYLWATWRCIPHRRTPTAGNQSTARNQLPAPLSALSSLTAFSFFTFPFCKLLLRGAVFSDLFLSRWNWGYPRRFCCSWIWRRTAYLSSSARGCSWRSKSRGPSSGAAFFVLWALGKCTMRMTSFCTLSAQCKSFKPKAWGNDPFWEVLRKHAG